MNNDSETSVDLNINILDNQGEKIELKDNNEPINVQNEKSKKPDSSDTDYYLNLLANQGKLNDDSDINSNTSSLSEIIGEDDSDNDDNNNGQEKSDSSHKSNISSSKPNYHTVRLTPKSSPRQEQPKFEPAPVESQNKVLSPQESRMKKIELLRKLSELKTKGYELSKSYDFNSSIEEMEYEYELLKSFANKRNGVKLYKNILLNTASAVEFLNDKYDPFDFQLTGWSEHMSVEVDSYDEVIEEIYEKYKGSGKKMAPELKLVLLIVASASAFHFSKSTFKNLPGVDKVLANNPDLIARMMNPQKESSQFMTEQEINLEKQRTNIIEKEKENRKNNKPINNNNPINNNKPINNNNPINNNKPINNKPINNKPINNNTMNSFKENKYAPLNRQSELNTQQEQSSLKAPINVQSILNRLHQSENNSNTSETQEETSSNNDRIVGTSSMNSSDKRKGRKKKNIMTIV